MHLSLKNKLLILCVVIGLLVSTGAQPPAVGARRDETLTVFAAASLTDAFVEIGARFEDQYGTRVIFNFGGSSRLAAQLHEGAPADVFASANPAQMAFALEAGDVVGPAQVFARNRLVLAVPEDNPAAIEALDDLAAPGVLLVLAAPDVPVRAYTDQMLDCMAADRAYGADFRAAVLANVVSEEPNVRQVAAKITFGEADAGLLYQSDITPDVAGDMTLIPIPDAFNPLASYPVARAAGAENPELARAFIRFLLSDDAQAILARWGFVPLREAAANGARLAGQAAPPACGPDSGTATARAGS